MLSRYHLKKRRAEPRNAKSLLETALAHPNTSALSVSLDVAKPALFHGASMAAEGRETVVDTLRRHLTTPA